MRAPHFTLYEGQERHQATNPDALAKQTRNLKLANRSERNATILGMRIGAPDA